jgi:hypothetical protein
MKRVELGSNCRAVVIVEQLSLLSSCHCRAVALNCLLQHKSARDPIARGKPNQRSIQQQRFLHPVADA